MRLIRGLHNIKEEHRPCVATIGSFDGVHLGHRHVIRQTQALAQHHGVASCVIIFEPQPREFFAAHNPPPRLTALRDKLSLLKAAGVDQVLLISFNHTLRHYSATQFVSRVLLQGLGIRALVVGEDFRFGQDRRGDYQHLLAIGKARGFALHQAQTFKLQGERVSSSKIRTMLLAQGVESANALLGHPYAISGRVVVGRKLGRTIGVPTANVLLKNLQPPLAGVYAVMVQWPKAHKRFEGVANFGYRPTLQGTTKPTLEVHLFDFDGMIYGETLSVFFLAHLRAERKFPSLEALRLAILQDISQAKKTLASAHVQDVG